MAAVSQTTLSIAFVRILITFSLKFVPKGPINNIPALVQIMAWRRPGDKPLSEPMTVSLLTHICVTQPQWVNIFKIGIISDWIKNSFHLNSCHIRRRQCPKDMFMADSHLFTYNILHYYHKVLIIGTFLYPPLNKVGGGYTGFTLFIVTLPCDNWSAATYRLCPRSHFHFTLLKNSPQWNWRHAVTYVLNIWPHYILESYCSNTLLVS